MGFILILATCLLTRVSCQLIINVSSGEADANVYRESVSGNLSMETVTINFLTPAGFDGMFKLLVLQIYSPSACCSLLVSFL